MYTHKNNLKKSQWFLYFLLALLFPFSSCTTDEEIEEETPFSFVKPALFPEPFYTFKGNEPSKERFELGRYLFYDKNLSVDGTVSCGDCHAQVHAFADHNNRYSEGIEGKLGKRNSPPIFNTAWQRNFMWDGGINHIEVMSFAPITNPVEMGHDMKNLMREINDNPLYKNKFKAAYGVDSINDRHLLIALAQFMSLILSDNSEYDQFLKGETKLTDVELKGLDLYKANCSSCHEGILFTSKDFFNNGLPINEHGDVGRMKVTQDTADKGRFKVPSLRNVELTYPYMHDGRFRTLDQVIDFYSSKDKDVLADDLAKKIPTFTEEEKIALKAFLLTLTDYTFLGNYMYSNPGELK